MWRMMLSSRSHLGTLHMKFKLNQSMGVLTTDRQMERLLHTTVMEDIGIFKLPIEGNILYVQGVSSGHAPGLVDFDFGCSTNCQILHRLMGIWRKWLGSRATWWNIGIKVNPTRTTRWDTLYIWCAEMYKSCAFSLKRGGQRRSLHRYRQKVPKWCWILLEVPSQCTILVRCRKRTCCSMRYRWGYY